MGQFDRSSKWLIQHHGDALLKLAGNLDFEWWRPLQAELVQPTKLPDGLIEARRRGSEKNSLYLIEIATNADPRVAVQVTDDELLVFLDRHELPETLVIVLRPRGDVQVPSSSEHVSPQGWSQLRAGWRVVELWDVPAERLLATGDPGVAPWVPLAKADSPAGDILRQCREIIWAGAAEDERDSLLAVTQILASLRYNDPSLLAILEEGAMLEESWVVQKWLDQGLEKGLEKGREEGHEEGLADGWAGAVLQALETRFGPVPQELAAAVHAVGDPRILRSLLNSALACASVAEFRERFPV